MPPGFEFVDNAYVQINGGEPVPVRMRKAGPVPSVDVDPGTFGDFKQIRSVWKCIYCGSTEQLEGEHVVPYGLSGTVVLPKSSCRECAKETGRFEQQVLRGGPMRAARLVRKLRSRSDHDTAARTQRLTLLRGDQREEVDLPLEQYPIHLNFPRFGPPGYITGVRGPGIRLIGYDVVLFGPTPQDVASQHGATGLEFPPVQMKPTAFARMLAKIGYAWAVASGADSLIDGPSPVTRSIRGLEDDVGQWVFTSEDQTVRYPGALHRLVIHAKQELNVLMAEVHLFADSGAPVYGVVLGPLKPGLTRSQIEAQLNQKGNLGHVLARL